MDCCHTNGSRESEREILRAFSLVISLFQKIWSQNSDRRYKTGKVQELRVRDGLVRVVGVGGRKEYVAMEVSGLVRH